jgi:RNA polymerase sigma-70 factor (ECF subfamily)
MLRRLGDNEAAAESYEAALKLATNDSERRFLERRLRECVLCHNKSTKGTYNKQMRPPD